MAGQGMDIQRLTGADIKSRHWDAFYQFYMNTTGACTAPALAQTPEC